MGTPDGDPDRTETVEIVAARRQLPEELRVALMLYDLVGCL